MDHRHKRDVHTSHTERSNGTTQIRQVQNVAFADATAKANVRPWTKAMFKVWVTRRHVFPVHGELTVMLVVPVSLHCYTELVY